jgi:AcrR family transcriptional regulator
MGTRKRVIDREDALAAAKRQFLSTGEISMDDLARGLNVSRATLYRVVGSRDELLGDILWQLSRRTLDQAIQAVRGSGLTGADRLLAISQRYHEAVASFKPLHHLLQQEAADAFRVLFTPSGRVHERMVEAWATLLREAQENGELCDLPFDVEETAYMFVRIGESMLYGDLLAGVVPDNELSDRIRRVLLPTSSPPPERG